MWPPGTSCSSSGIPIQRPPPAQRSFFQIGTVRFSSSISSRHPQKASARGEAYSGCRELRDELKRTVPIWKKERWAGGGRWIGIPDELQEVPTNSAVPPHS